eukprot:403351116
MRHIKNNRRNVKFQTKLSDVSVKFPFEKPYQCQLKMMQAEQQGTIDLESDQEDNEEETCLLDIPSTIIYCTRTHSQINQIFEEIKLRLPYVLRVSPFASRKQSCIFENLPEQFPGNSLNLSCKLLRKLNTIQQKLNKDATLKLTKLKSGSKNDIENCDQQVSVIKSGCPFYYGYSFENKMSMKQSEPKQFGQIIISSAQQDKSINLVASQIPWDQPLSDSVIIFDEGHNIDTFCEELFTFDISINDLFQAYQQLNQIWLDLQAEEQLLTEYQRYQLKGQRLETKSLCVFVLKIIDVLETYNLDRSQHKITILNLPENMNVFRLPELFSLFAMVFGKLKDEKDMMIENMKNKHQKFSAQKDGSNDQRTEHQQELTFTEKLEMFILILQTCIVESGDKGKSLNKLYDTLLKVKIAYTHFQSQKNTVNNYGNKVTHDKRSGYYDFYMCIFEEQHGYTQSKRKIALWCFNPSFAFQSLLEEKPRNIIFSSGTLAPLHTYESELETTFPIKLENDHVIDKDSQVMVSILTHDIDNKQIQFSFEKREDLNFYLVFARTLARIFAKVHQGGILVFLPSYTVLKKLHKVWRDNKLYKDLFKQWDIFIEPQDQVKNSALFEDYKRAIQTQKRAVFIAVCRGKLSEGIDFTDDVARCVIMAGIPYPQIYDPKVITKKDYLDRKYAQGKSIINGNQWYKLQACRAINQAIGRVIRHINDFGAIILMDERYVSHNIEISKWLNLRKKIYNQFVDLEVDLENFFIQNGCMPLNDIKDIQKGKAIRKRQQKHNHKLSIKSQKPSPNTIDSLALQYEYDIPNEIKITDDLRSSSSSTSPDKPQKPQNSVVPTISNSESINKINQLINQSGSFSTSTFQSMGNSANASCMISGNSKLKQQGNRLYRDDYDEGEFFGENLGFSGESFQQSMTSQASKVGNPNYDQKSCQLQNQNQNDILGNKLLNKSDNQNYPESNIMKSSKQTPNNKNYVKSSQVPNLSNNKYQRNSYNLNSQKRQNTGDQYSKSFNQNQEPSITNQSPFTSEPKRIDESQLNNQSYQQMKQSANKKPSNSNNAFDSHFESPRKNNSNTRTINKPCSEFDIYF